jgi:hypothetical protein
MRTTKLTTRFLLHFGVVLALGWSCTAMAQEPGEIAPAQPLWLTALLGLLPVVVGAVLAIHPLLKLAAWLDARALDTGRSAAARAALLGTESLAKSVDHYLEATNSDYSDLADPAKRAAALKHIKDQAEAGALPALKDAIDALGSSWFAGAASAAVDQAAAKAAAPTAAADVVKGAL